MSVTDSLICIECFSVGICCSFLCFTVYVVKWPLIIIILPASALFKTYTFLDLKYTKSTLSIQLSALLFHKGIFVNDLLMKLIIERL